MDGFLATLTRLLTSCFQSPPPPTPISENNTQSPNPSHQRQSSPPYKAKSKVSHVVTDDELKSLSAACNKLWKLDTNRLNPEVDYAINLQHGKKPYQEGDFAPDSLFKYVNDQVWNKPTYKLFSRLLDNYTAEVGMTEIVTPEELTEQKDFLVAIMETSVMQYVHQYLLKQNKSQNVQVKDFINELQALWFTLYSRKAKNDSSGFEHVFLGEIKDNQVIGMHNWIQIYLQEKKGDFNYKGYIKPKKTERAHTPQQPHNNEQFITMQFEWKKASKMISSSFIGTSPEFEFALYTLCFYCGGEVNHIELGEYQVKLTCHKWNQGHRTYVATSFPSNE